MPESHRPDARGRRSQPRADPPAPRARAAPDDRFFRQIVRSMRNGVIAFKRDGTLTLMNDEAYRMFGVSRSDADVGRAYGEVLRERPAVIRVLAGAFELSHLPNRAELRLPDLNRVVGYTLSQVKDERGDTIGAVMFFKDLTRVEQLEERERLRDRLAALGEMAAGIAHELKNPLAGIEVMAGLLRRQVADSTQAQALLADIMSEAKLANAIVVEMLEFVRPIRLQVEQTDLAQVVHQSITLAESKVKRGNVRVHVDLAEGLPLIDGDLNQLSQVFSNLLTNAFEAMDGKGQVTIRATPSAIEVDPAMVGLEATATPVIVVDVIDDGPGVPAEATDKIFDPFFTTKPQGSGLGLAIVRKIVDAHDGRIDVNSASGRGTCFRVTLPVANAPAWFK
jgi:PAS domain S-box-containing protein